MRFEPNTIYHIFNQGNNREPIFFQERNYHFFVGKMKKHLLPYGELICYCLMPNHFHWLFYTNAEACEPIKKQRKSSDESLQETVRQSSDDFSRRSSDDLSRQQRLSRAIGTLLSSYTRAINNQENRSGSLFRPKTKAKDGWIDDFITVDGKHRVLFFGPDNDYALQCFEYIHQNPVKAGLVLKPEDWPYSSAREYEVARRLSSGELQASRQATNLPKESICNVEFGRKILGL